MRMRVGHTLGALLLLLALPGWAGETAPNGAQIDAALAKAHRDFAGLTDGHNADYIPVLAQVPSDLFGIVIVTVDGTVHAVGDTDHPFAIESISKVFTLAAVMQAIGADAVQQKIGVDPTGMPFNSVMALELHDDAPLNPFVNAGAITTTALVQGANTDEQWATILGTMDAFAGHPLNVDGEVDRSEAATNQHNRGIAYLLQSAGHIAGDPMEATRLYTRQCSVAVTARDLGVMGATLAAGGVNPVTGERVIDGALVPRILAVMAMNGLYDGSGDWFYEVGLPAKSGVGGGIVAVVPGVLAIAAFSPPLDEHGNSVRAWHAIAQISQDLGLNLLGP